MNKVLSNNFRAFKLLLKRYPKIFISMLCYQVIKSVIPFISIYYSARIINALILKDSSAVWTFVTLTIGITALLMLLEAFAKRWMNYEQTGIYYKKLKIYSDKFYKMDFEKIDNSKTHDLFAQIQQNENWSDWGFGRVFDCFEDFCSNMATTISSITLTVSLFQYQVQARELKFLNSWIFVVILCVALGLLVVIPAHLETKGSGYWAKISDDAREGNRVFSFYFKLFSEKDRALDIRIYNQQNEGKKIIDSNNIFVRSGKLAAYARKEMGLLIFFARFLSSSLIFLIYSFVCLKALGGAFSIGEITQYIASITALSTGLNGLFKVVGLMKNNTEFLQVCFEFLDIKNNMCKGNLKVEKSLSYKYEIEFKNVSFKYPNSSDFVLKNLNFSFHVGNRLAIVGKNGSGKTTFIKLLCRLYDPIEGEILLNGVNIKEYDYKEYLSIFSVVFQDFQLLAFQLAENIAASMQFKEDLVNESLEKAGFNIDAGKFKKGINTYIYRDFTDEGVNVSGGEGQKIAIARALFKDSAFIILDEPTAALDPLAEQEIYEKFNDMVKNKTAIYISHRLSSCRFCDEIAVFDKGSIVEHGTHKELLSIADGLYHELWTTQASYYQE